MRGKGRILRVVMGAEMLAAADQAAQKAEVRRSAEAGDVVGEQLREAEVKELEARDRAGYDAWPVTLEEWEDWERGVVWE